MCARHAEARQGARGCDDDVLEYSRSGDIVDVRVPESSSLKRNSGHQYKEGWRSRKKHQIAKACPAE
jgi:hypothetical protein